MGVLFRAFASSLFSQPTHHKEKQNLLHLTLRNKTPARVETLAELAPEAVRAARLSRVLFHFVRSGGGMSPRVRGKKFSRFVEGHASVVRIEDKALYLNFDNQGEEIGPLALPSVMIDMVAMGDVFDVELGLRGDSWVLVDIGPIYPACVYVEIEEYQGLEKLS